MALSLAFVSMHSASITVSNCVCECRMDASSASKRSFGISHINTLPDELLSQLLSLLPFATKAAVHRVSKRWNSILRSPVISHVYGDCELDLTAASLTPLRERELWRIADWLARRAYGIQLLLINSGPWRGISGDVTESGFFYAQQLPYLMGQLRHKQVQLSISFWSTGLSQNKPAVSLRDVCYSFAGWLQILT